MNLRKLFFCAAVFLIGTELMAKQVSEGVVIINNQQLKAVLFDEPALNPACRERISASMQAMFYLNGQTFSHGCWVIIGNEIHTQMTRYDTQETRAFVFSASVFQPTENPNLPSRAKNKSHLKSDAKPSWCTNAKLPHENTICNNESLYSKENQILDLFATYQRNATEDLRAHKIEFFKKIKLCGTDKECISKQQDERINFYESRMQK